MLGEHMEIRYAFDSTAWKAMPSIYFDAHALYKMYLQEEKKDKECGCMHTVLSMAMQATAFLCKEGTTRFSFVGSFFFFAL